MRKNKKRFLWGEVVAWKTKGGLAGNGHTPSVTRKLSALPPVPAPKRHLGVIRIEAPPWTLAPGLTSHDRGSCPIVRCHARVQQESSSERRASMTRLGMSGFRKNRTRRTGNRQETVLFRLVVLDKIYQFIASLSPHERRALLRRP